MKTLNVRFLAILVGSGVALAILVGVVHHFQVRRHANFFLERARMANAEEAPEKRVEALDDYNRYLALRPWDNEANAEMGLLLADLGLREPAFIRLEEVVRKDSSRADVRRRLVELAMGWGRFTDAREHLKVLQKSLPDDAELMEMLGRCQMGTEEYHEAEQSFLEAIETDPARLESYVFLANILRYRLERPDEADAWMDKMVAANEELPRAYILRASHLRRIGKLEEAEADIAKALELAPDNEEALLAAAEDAMESEHFDVARQHAQRVVELFPESVRGYDTLALIEAAADRLDTAHEWLDKGLVVTEDHPELLFRKAQYLLEEGRADEADPIIRRLAAVRFPQPLLVFLQAQSDYARGDWAKASQALEQIRTELLQGGRLSLARRANLVLADCYQHLRRPELRQAALERVRQFGAQSRAEQETLTAVLQKLAGGDFGAAVEEYRKSLIERGGSIDKWVNLVRTAISRNVQTPDESQRDWKLVDQLLADAFALEPDNTSLVILKAESLRYRGQTAEAHQYIRDSLKKLPEQWGLYHWLILRAVEKEEWDKTLQVINEAKEHIGETVPLRLAQAQVLVERDGVESVPELKKLAVAPEDFTEDERSQLWYGLAMLTRETGDRPLALEFCQKAVKARPNDLTSRYLLFDLAMATKNKAAMDEALEDIRRIENEGPYWHYLKAVALVADTSKDDRQSREQALTWLAKAAVLRPNWPDVIMMEAKLRHEMGDHDAAINKYLEAVDQGSRDPVGMTQLHQLLMSQGRTSEAMRILRLLEEEKVDIGAHAFLQRAQENLREGNLDQALVDLGRAVEESQEQAVDSEDPLAHVRLAEALRNRALTAKQQGDTAAAKRDFEEAEKSLRRAIELGPEDSANWLRLVLLLKQADNPRGAAEAITGARAALPPEKVPLVLAQCYEQLGRLVEAEQQYNLALEKTPDTPGVASLAAEFFLNHNKTDRGETLQKEIIEGKWPATKDEKIRARQWLAVLTLNRREHQAFADALALIDENLKENPDSLIDRRLKGKLLASRATRKHRDQARAIFQSLVERPRPDAADRFDLAKLLLLDQDWSGASRQMEPLLAREQVDPEWLAFYIRAQIRRNEFSGAEMHLRRLDQFAPNALPTSVLWAQLYSSRGDHDRAIDVIKRFIDNPKAHINPKGSQPANHVVKLKAGADALVAMASQLHGPGRDQAAAPYLQAAEECLRDYITMRPDQEMAMVRFLGAQGRFDDALHLAENGSGKGSPVDIASSVASLVNTGNPTAEQIDRVEKILNQAMKEHPEEGTLLLALAELEIIRQHYDEAEAIYRGIIDDAEQDLQKRFIAMNNLAVFHAMRKAKLDEALTLINQAIEIAGPSATLLDSRASVRIARGEWQEALDDINMALEEEPSGVRYFHQAQAFFLGKDTVGAAEAMRQADAYGLTVEMLQPLERPAYRQLREDLQ